MAERHGFTKETIKELSDRVGSVCSNPDCNASTKGPHSDGESAINVGVAAHIHAASPGGPRFDADQSEADRKAIHNAIWLCQTCAKLIDSDSDRFHPPLLRAWRARAELEAFERLGKPSQLRRAIGSTPQGIEMSAAALETLKSLGRAYLEADFPNHKCWTFQAGPRVEDADRREWRELVALGAISLMGTRGGPYRLTDAGKVWVLRNQRSLAAEG